MVEKANSLDELLEDCPKNSVICDNLIRAWAKINSPMYQNIICSISGGSDSDIMLDIVWRCDKENKINYVWFNTGLEYYATKNHLKYLENKYNITIKPYKAIKSIPLSCKEYGQPFISKYVSEMISRLQKHNFKWEDRPFEELYKEYPKCKIALNWWCNHSEDINGNKSRFNISYNKFLKEFIIQNPLKFRISNKCCLYAKKKVVYEILKENNYDLNIVGIRKAEGGARSSAYKSCFDDSGDGFDNYRPIFWYKDSDKKMYEKAYDIVHSKCYTEYGLSRTGCSGCPYGRGFEYELEVIKKYEPNLFTAANHIFGDSYEYTRQYKQYCKEMNEKQRKGECSN